MVSDLPRIGEWSPECEQVDWLDGSTGPAEGATFIGHNAVGPGGLHELVAPRPGAHRRPRQEFTFITDEGGRESTLWRYRFEPTASGTMVTEGYEVHWIPTWARILDVPTNRHRSCATAMRTLWSG